MVRTAQNYKRVSNSKQGGYGLCVLSKDRQLKSGWTTWHAASRNNGHTSLPRVAYLVEDRPCAWAVSGGPSFPRFHGGAAGSRRVVAGTSPPRLCLRGLCEVRVCRGAPDTEISSSCLSPIGRQAVFRSVPLCEHAYTRRSLLSCQRSTRRCKA